MPTPPPLPAPKVGTIAQPHRWPPAPRGHRSAEGATATRMLQALPPAALSPSLAFNKTVLATMFSSSIDELGQRRQAAALQQDVTPEVRSLRATTRLLPLARYPPVHDPCLLPPSFSSSALPRAEAALPALSAPAAPRRASPRYSILPPVVWGLGSSCLPPPGVWHGGAVPQPRAGAIPAGSAGPGTPGPVVRGGVGGTPQPRSVLRGGTVERQPPGRAAEAGAGRRQAEGRRPRSDARSDARSIPGTGRHPAAAGPGRGARRWRYGLLDFLEILKGSTEVTRGNRICSATPLFFFILISSCMRHQPLVESLWILSARFQHKFSSGYMGEMLVAAWFVFSWQQGRSIQQVKQRKRNKTDPLPSLTLFPHLCLHWLNPCEANQINKHLPVSGA